MEGILVFKAVVLIHQNHLQGLLRHRLLGSIPKASDSVGLAGPKNFFLTGDATGMQTTQLKPVA